MARITGTLREWPINLYVKGRDNFSGSTTYHVHSDDVYLKDASDRFGAYDDAETAMAHVGTGNVRSWRSNDYETLAQRLHKAGYQPVSDREDGLFHWTRSPEA